MLSVKENNIKMKIREGEVVIGSYCNPLNLSEVELYGQAGYDFVVLDTEHGPYFGVDHCLQGVKVAMLAGVTPFIRVSHNNPIIIEKALGMGAYGVWVPHVDTKEECKQAVQSSKYLPVGNRNPPNSSDYIDNDQIITTVLPLESKKGIDNIEEILSVDGLDMISLSVGDITTALGYPGQPMHPEVVKVRDRVWELCQDMGVKAYSVGSFDIIKYYRDKGVHVFMSGVNVRKAFQDHMTALRKIVD
jgi:4-hydroxy-2-oxoheptanedioate aldolase